MVKPDVFAIVYDEPNRVYQPGQTVSGHVDLQLSKKMKTKGIILTLYGGANTHWTETETQSFVFFPF
jgi:hypothetical protein